MALRLRPNLAVDAGIDGREAPGVPVQPASPWLSLLHAARYIGYDAVDEQKTADAMRRLAKRHGLPLYRRGRRLLLDRREVDTWLRRSRVA